MGDEQRLFDPEVEKVVEIGLERLRHLRIIHLIGQEKGESPRQVLRYIRLTLLIERTVGR